jgi:hypothetical protein
MVLAIGVLATGALVAAAADTQSAANTRNKKLKTRISVNFEEARLSDALKEINKLLEDADGPTISFQLATGVSQNLQITCSAKDKTVAEILELMFKKNGLGYIVVSKEKDRYDGWVLIRQGKERGYPEGEEPAKKGDKAEQKEKDKADAKDKPMAKDKPADDAEKTEMRAASRLTQAQELLKDGKKAKAKQYCEEIIKQYPQTKAAEKAKALLEKIDK